ncbi:hypothetical protein [Arthrobacter sp. StoSoilB22]|uniref:hypothetical protein n=1 Tax=Arthrobacter sp. StoSoilB22 TaxID=2830996 RepID=UPI001CC3DB1A|nr:hypothetical protein [Arthrobacter sp. StoSoilB22]BCW61872.1 hypothetical protein StoSoilB22_08450 [Arthrobacter sp. StoSoilB22]
MNTVGQPSVKHRRRLEPLDQPMHFMKGPIAGVLPGIIQAIPPSSDVTITETRDTTGKKALTITATWNEDQ